MSNSVDDLLTQAEEEVEKQFQFLKLAEDTIMYLVLMNIEKLEIDDHFKPGKLKTVFRCEMNGPDQVKYVRDISPTYARDLLTRMKDKGFKMPCKIRVSHEKVKRDWLDEEVYSYEIQLESTQTSLEQKQT